MLCLIYQKVRRGRKPKNKKQKRRICYEHRQRKTGNEPHHLHHHIHSTHREGIGDSLGPRLIAGFTGGLVLYIPVRLFPQLGLIGSVIVMFVIGFLYVGVSSFLGGTLGSVVAFVLLLAAFIASLLFL